MTHELRHEAALWWQKGVIYQIYPRSYMDSNGDGIGDLKGVIGRLDYLVELGVDAIWLSPFYRSPMKDFGYDVSDYTDVDPMFGTLADFDELVKAAHARNLRIVVDYVPNHTSNEHPWFLESRSSRTNPKADWYVWGTPKPDGTQPNNWLSVFGGVAWTYEDRRKQYYLHSFLKEQPDLNWRNPQVRSAMLGALEFWLQRGVDGFRLDVAHFIMKDPTLRDNPVNPGDTSPTRGLYDYQVHIHDKGHPDVHGVFREMRALFDHYSTIAPRYSIGEIHIYDWDQWAEYYGHNDELHMPFNFGFIHVNWNAADVRKIVDGVEAALKKRPTLAWPNYVLGNHDEHRIGSRVGPAQARVAMMLLLTLRGTPTMYYGDEIGMHNVEIPEDQRQDPWEFNNRDPQRTPMQWDAGPNAGFSAPDATPWLPLAEDYEENNVAAQQHNHRSMLQLTRQLLHLRRGTPALAVGSYIGLDDVPPNVFAYIRQSVKQRRLVLLNFTDSDCTLNLLHFGPGKLHLSTHLDRTGDINLAAFTLRGNEGCVLEIADAQ